MKKENNARGVDRKKAVVTFEDRRNTIVSCPHCWTDQRSERDFCYRCGATFVYLNELKKADGADARRGAEK